MKTQYLGFLLCTGLLLFTSCGSEPVESPQGTITELPSYQLSIADSFGVEIGDSVSMIGSIDDMCYSADGSILVLDCVTQNVREFSSEAETKLLCQSGEGPGQFLYPLALCALENGNFLVSDEMKQEIMEYSSDGVYTGSFLLTGGYVPYSMYPVDSNTIIADQLVLDMESEVPQYIYLVCGYRASASEPFQVYEKLQWDWASADLYRDIGLQDFVADTSGRVFIASDVTDYRISVFAIDGTLCGEISESVLRVRKTPEQIEQEIEEFEEWAQQDQAYMGGYQPSEYKQVISLAGIDSAGNIWVQRYDSGEDYSFDIWDQSFNLISTASFPRETGSPEITFHVDEHGILGANTNSEDYPRVYSFEIRDFSQ